MLSRSVPRLLRASSTIRASSCTSSTTRQAVVPLCRSYPVHPRTFTSSAFFSKGIQPDSENPRPSNPESTPIAGLGAHVTEPSPLTPEEYHEYSEHYFNVLLGELEKAQEEGSDVEAEYSVSDSLHCISYLYSILFPLLYSSRISKCFRPINIMY
jgi:frataxin